MSSCLDWSSKAEDKEPAKLPKSERATFGPDLPFALPVLVLAVLTGRVVVASSGAARFLPASHQLYSASAWLDKKIRVFTSHFGDLTIQAVLSRWGWMVKEAGVNRWAGTTRRHASTITWHSGVMFKLKFVIEVV